MTADAGPSTSPTLLERLRRAPTDQQAWSEFVDRYGPKIYAWALGHRLQEADAQEVTANVLGLLAGKMRTFAYDPKKGTFRAWLHTVTEHAWYDFTHDPALRLGGRGSGNDHVDAWLHAVEARAELLPMLEEVFDLEILEEASARVQVRVEPDTWAAFVLTVTQGLSCDAAALRLGTTVGNIYKRKSRVQHMITEEVHVLGGRDP